MMSSFPTEKIKKVPLNFIFMAAYEGGRRLKYLTVTFGFHLNVLMYFIQALSPHVQPC